jgi:hypothetical protein
VALTCSTALLDERIEPLTAVAQMLDDFLSHARVPEFGEMIGDPGNRRFVLFRPSCGGCVSPRFLSTAAGASRPTRISGP